MIEAGKAAALGILTIFINCVLMLIKILAGVFGNSYALIADGIESAADVFTSLITWAGFHLSLRPPDKLHPFGHGKIESLAGLFSGCALVLAAVFIAFQCVQEILTPHHSPEWFTLPILIFVVLVKEMLSRRILSFAGKVNSRALEGDAWHHRSDALSSGAAAAGIATALIGGPAWAAADDWAALFACAIILFNGGRIISRSLHETLDGRVDSAFIEKVTNQARGIEGVENTEKCMVRKSGTRYFTELHVQVRGDLPVVEGHRIGHAVKTHLLAAIPELMDVVVHLEPFEPPDSKNGPGSTFVSETGGNKSAEKRM